MNKLYISTLGLIVTNKCNLDCAHCLRGCKNNDDMTDEVIEATLSNFKGIGNLAICGGEPTMAIPVIEKIFDYVMTNHIFLEEVTVTINGTIYNNEFIRLLDTINNYILKYKELEKNRKSQVEIVISLDNYHYDEIDRLGLNNIFKENIHNYDKSIHFYEFRGFKKNIKLFREGNALNLPSNLTIDLRPMNILVTYAGKNKKFDEQNGLCNIGPIVTISTDGIVTECDASIDNQKTKYNYGSVLDEPLEQIILKRAKVLTPRKWNRQYKKELKRYDNYNK